MNQTKLVVALWSFLLCTTIVLSGCATSGPQRAAKLVSRVEDSRQALQQTKMHMQDALAAAYAIGQTEGGKLESDFQRLDSQVKETGEKIIEFRKRMADMNKTSDEFFTSWTMELDKYATEEFRKRSEVRLKETRGRYNRVATAMQRPDEKLNPFWAQLHDLALFLNHNLNPQGVASIKNALKQLNAEAAELYKLIDVAVGEADQFAITLGP